MCYDAKTSITTFGFVSILCVYLWYRNSPYDRAISLILFYVTLVQLIEFILWTNLGENPVNKTVSSIIPIMIFSQPLVIAFIMWFFKAGWYTEAYKYIVYLCLILLPLWYIIDTSTAKTPYTTVGPTGHLVWPSSTGDKDSIHVGLSTLYLFMALFLLGSFKKPSIAIALTTGYAISWFYYKYYYDRDFSTLWCHSSNTIALVALL
jgi:hypothetical protein